MSANRMTFESSARHVVEVPWTALTECPLSDLDALDLMMQSIMRRDNIRCCTFSVNGSTYWVFFIDNDGIPE